MHSSCDICSCFYQRTKTGASLDAQKAAMEDYCAKKGLKIVNKYRAIESSTNGKRVAFYEMLDFVRKQKNKTAIVVHCIDRFQRRFNECVEVEIRSVARRISEL